MFPAIASIPCMHGVATKYSCSTKSSGDISFLFTWCGIIFSVFKSSWVYSCIKLIGTIILRNSLINKLGTFNGFSKRKILYFATCFCFVLALLLLTLSFSFFISLLTNFSSGVSNALKALGRAFLTFVSLSHNLFHWASLLRTAGKQNKMLLRRLPGPRKRVKENVHTYAHARTKTIPRPKYIYISRTH